MMSEMMKENDRKMNKAMMMMEKMMTYKGKYSEGSHRRETL